MILGAAQVAAVPPGEPPARLRFVHMDRLAAVYVDEAFTRPDVDEAGTIRTRSLHVPFDTAHEPAWLTERHDCDLGLTQPLWRESAIGMMYDGPRDIAGVLTAWDDGAPDSGAAVGQAVCAPPPEQTPSSDPLSPDEAMNRGYQLALEVRFQPALYEQTGDVGESLDFLGLASDGGVGWFVEPRSDRPDGEGAIADVLTINCRSRSDSERFVWRRLRFDCRGHVLTLQGERYAEGPRHIGSIMSEPMPVDVESNSLMPLVQQYACAADDPPALQPVPGLESAIAGITAHVAANDALPRN
ncbi:MAG: hypothetical protein KKA16_08840 [Alphaproteobacteria bacterium]|nr:hypothetical protein [Alphaproteobacteria bacterium]MBU1539923.1 hypothetical protein [Alphaproteobacteria bacterium]MBU2380115.1 hypothetical protein [Alphaproteobacteria bacterium]